MTARVSIYLDPRVQKESELFPLKIRVTFNRQRRYYGVKAKHVNDLLIHPSTHNYIYKGFGNYSIDKETFEKTMGKAPRGVYKYLKDVFVKIESEFQKKADNINKFTFEGFSNEIYKINPEDNVFMMMERKINELEKEDRVGYAITYRCCLNSLKKFTEKDNVSFDYFILPVVKKYETWMISKKNSYTTIGIYLRTLRALYNEAIQEKITENYPFGKDGYKIPTGKGRKIALSTAELIKLLNYELDSKDSSNFYFDIWKLTYYLNGINVKDLVLLKKKDIEGEFIRFIREKTKRTSKGDLPIIKIFLSDEAKIILMKWETSSDSDFLLPFLTGKESEKEIKNKVNSLTSMVNQSIKKISLALGINKKPSTYTARHSWATQLMRNGASTSLIQKQLGHKNSSTTDAYLEDFDDEIIKEFQKKVSSFNK